MEQPRYKIASTPFRVITAIMGGFPIVGAAYLLFNPHLRHIGVQILILTVFPSYLLIKTTITGKMELRLGKKSK